MMTKENDFLVDGKYSILDLVNLERLRNIFEQFTRSTGLALGLLDHPSLNILIGAGVRRICSEYHRRTPTSEEICRRSNRRLVEQLESPGSFVIEECGNGLLDCATPVIVKGKHIATLVTGQFLMKPPDVERFRRQAKAHGYDEACYMSALKDVPVLSEERVRSLAVSLRESAAVISEMGLASLEMKDETARLANEVAERKRVEEMLRQSERNYREIFNATNDAIFVHDADTGAILDANDAVLRLFGFTREEALRLSPDDSSLGIRPYSAAEVRQWVQKALHEGPQVFEWRARKKSGELFWAEVALRSADISGHRRVLAVVRDITDRKQTEEALGESEEKYRSLVENSLEGIGISRGDQIVYANRALLSLFGYETQEEFIARPQPDHVAPESRELVRKLMDRPVGGDASHALFECKIIRKDGTIRDVEVSVTGISIKGREYSQSTFRDITERKRAENVLRASTEVMRAIPSGLIVYQFEPPDKLFLMDANPAALKYTGLKLEECVGKEFHDLWPEAVADGTINHYLNAIRTSEPFVHELIFPSGQRLKGAYYLVAFKMPENRLGVAFEDITDRKRAEEELFSSRQMLQLVLDNVPQRIFWKDINSVFLGCNKALAMECGYTEPSELIGKTDYEIIPAEQAERYRDADRQVIQTGRPKLNVEVCHVLKDGRRAWLRTNLIPLPDKDGRVIGVLGTYEDITDRKQAEEALRESEEKYRNLVENSIEGITMSRGSKIVFANRAMLRMTGYDSVEEWMARPYMEIVAPESREMIRARLEKRARGEPVPVEFELKLFRKDGQIRDVECSVAEVMLKGEKYVQSTFRDVTERRRAEAERDLLFDYSLDLMCVEGVDGHLKQVNPAWERTLGFSTEELLNKPWTEFIHPDDIEIVRRVREQLQKGQPVRAAVSRHYCKDGSYRWLSWSAFPLIDEGVIFAVGRDITDRKEAEEALQAERAFANVIMDSIPGTFFVVDRQGRLIRWNRMLEELMEVSSDQLSRMMGLETIYEGDRDMMARKMAETFEKGYGEAEARAASKGNPYSFFSGRRIEMNGEQFIVGTGLNITERKRTEEALRTSEAFLSSVIDQSPFPMWISDDKGTLIRVNRACCESLNVSSEELVGKYNVLEDNVVAEQGLMPVVRRVYEKGETVRFEMWYDASLLKNIRLAQAAARYVDLTMFPIKDASGKLTNAVIQYMDITDRKQAEESLRRRSEELRTLNSLMEKINATLSLDEVISVSTQAVAGLVQSDVVFFFVREGEDLVLRRTAFRDSDVPHEEIPLHHVGKCLCGLAALSGKPMYSNDIHADERCTMEECRRMGFKSFAALPLLSGQETIGVLGLGWRSRRNMSEYSAFLETMAGQVSAACRNALLYRQVREHAVDLEHRVTERTALLAAANKELEAFSYSVSHDLRAPLRTIDGFSHILEEDYAEKLDTQGKEHLTRVRQGCQRMSQLIDDLLNLSRITRSELNRGPVDLAMLAREVISSLQIADPQRQVEWIAPAELKVGADENLMRILLENLLGNAWKFTRHTAQPRIELGLTQQDGRDVCFIRDNGAGFNMAYAGKLFSPFQRLHSDREFEGTGVGLAIVQRIVHRHGGRVWAEGKEGQGATFFFTLA